MAARLVSDESSEEGTQAPATSGRRHFGLGWDDDNADGNDDDRDKNHII